MSPGLNHLLEIFLEVDNIGKLKGGRDDNNNYDDNDVPFTIFFQLNFYHLACQGLLIIRYNNHHQGFPLISFHSHSKSFDENLPAGQTMELRFKVKKSEVFFI